MSAPPLDLDRVRRNFDGHAGEYDRYARVQKRVAERLTELAAAHPPPAGRVLDLGCGTGAAARAFRPRLPQATFVVSDIAHAMTARARTALPGSLALDADAHALPLREGCCAGIVSTSVFQWVEDLPGVFRECCRVLAPGGLLAFALFGEGTLRELHDSFEEALSRTGSTRPSHFQVFPGLTEVSAALDGAGLELHDCHAEEECEYHPTFRALMASLKGIGALNASRERPAGLFPRRVMAELTALYGERFLAPQGLPATYAVIYGVASKPGASGSR